MLTTCTIFTRLKVNVIEFILKYYIVRNRLKSTDKSLKHLKSKDKFLIANVSNYFEKHSGQDSSSYI